jgi:hypothetical protein
MNCLIWNCRGAGGKEFSAIIRDYSRIYNIDLVAILEPRISGDRADTVIKKFGFSDSVKVDAHGFSGGIWVAWKSSCPPISVISMSRFCVHLQINGNSPDSWTMTIVYASPHIYQRKDVWAEIEDFNRTINGPWCIAGDFNHALYEHEKQGGGPINQVGSSDFSTCIHSCQLLDLGFKGQPFTWFKGALKERLDRILCNAAWHAKFPRGSNTHLPMPSSDHVALWLRMKEGRTSRRNYFKFLTPWLEHDDFVNQIRNSWILSDNWSPNIQRVTNNLKDWNHNLFGNIFKRKRRVIKRLEGINNNLVQGENDRLRILKIELELEYNQIVHQEESYWMLQAKNKWLSQGDANTKFFHQSSITRRRRNHIMALKNASDDWVYDDSDLQDLVTNFFKELYTSNGIPSSDLVTQNGFPSLDEANILTLQRAVSFEETK